MFCSCACAPQLMSSSKMASTNTWIGMPLWRNRQIVSSTFSGLTRFSLPPPADQRSATQNALHYITCGGAQQQISPKGSGEFCGQRNSFTAETQRSQSFFTISLCLCASVMNPPVSNSQWDSVRDFHHSLRSRVLTNSHEGLYCSLLKGRSGGTGRRATFRA